MHNPKPKPNPKKIFVTGVSSGVGRAIADELCGRGHEVWGISSGGPSVDFHSSFHWLKMDLGQAIDRVQALKQIPFDLGDFDILILNAGQGELGSVEETKLETSRHLFEVNYWSNVDLIQRVLPTWRGRKSGQIIALGSVVTELHFPFKAQYSASKAALTAMLDSLRFEVEEFGIRIQVLEPGWIRSNFHNRLNALVQNHSAYAHRFKSFLDFSKDRNLFYPDGAAVARIIVHCIDGLNGSFRIPVGPDAKLFFYLGRFLPLNLRAWTIRRMSRGS